MTDKVRVKVQIQAKHIIHFQFYHTYISAYGILMMVLALLSVYNLVNGPQDQNIAITLVMLFLMLWSIVITPLMLFLRSIRQSKQVALFKSPMEFEVSSKGIGLYQDKNKGEYAWKDITKVVIHKSVAIFYMGKSGANLLPLDQISDQRSEVIRIIKKYAAGRIVGYVN